MGTQLGGKTVLITGAALRIGRALALACAHAGANVIIHYHHSTDEAMQLQRQIQEIGPQAWTIPADLAEAQAASHLIEQAASQAQLFALVNNASVFETLGAAETTAADWNRHMAVNLRAPFLLSQSFANQLPPGERGCIINMLDWRALRSGTDHFPYTISKAGLAALTRLLARAFAPHITVNGLALGAILPPADDQAKRQIIEEVPAGKWGSTHDVSQALIFLLGQGSYITGQIIHVDGGRHLV